MDSSFKSDLNSEAALVSHLGAYYAEAFIHKGYSTKRAESLSEQNKGIDLYLNSNANSFKVDEKAQLDYLGKNLPTFAFELSYLKKSEWKQGWLYDEKKETEIYFLITNIHPLEGDLSKGIEKFKLTGVYRNRLLSFLENKGLNRERITALDNEIRNEGKDGKIIIPELNSTTEGNMYFSKSNKAEQPINLVLKLKMLAKMGIGKELINL